MTRAQSVEVLNDSTTMQSRIDTVLAAPVMEWDHSPEIGWQPAPRPKRADTATYLPPTDKPTREVTP